MATTKKTTSKKVTPGETTAQEKPFKTAAQLIKEMEEQGVKEPENRPKSKIELFWETIPENRFEIIDMDAILE